MSGLEVNLQQCLVDDLPWRRLAFIKERGDLRQQAMARVNGRPSPSESRRVIAALKIAAYLALDPGSGRQPGSRTGCHTTLNLAG